MRCYVVAARGASRHVRKDVMMKDVMKVTTRDVGRVVTTAVKGHDQKRD